jgi:hypothetical protein
MQIDIMKNEPRKKNAISNLHLLINTNLIYTVPAILKSRISCNTSSTRASSSPCAY